MTWTSEEVYAKDLQPGDRFTSRWQGDHTVAMQEACTVVTTGYRPLGGLSLEIEMPSGDHATRVFNAGNRVFRWTELSDSEPAQTPRFTLTDEKDPDHPGILDAERPDRVAATGHPIEVTRAILETWDDRIIETNLSWADFRTTGEPEVAAAVKGLGPSDEFEERNGYPEPFLPKETTDRILMEEPKWHPLDARASYAAEASEDLEDEPKTEAEKLEYLALLLRVRDAQAQQIDELRRDLAEMWD